MILAGWPILMYGNVRFVDLDLGFDDRQVRNRQQHGAGVVHGADDGRFALFDVPARDDARRSGETMRTLFRSYLALSRFASSCLMRCSCVRTDCSLTMQVGLAHLDVVLGALELLARNAGRPWPCSSCRCSVSFACCSATLRVLDLRLRLFQLRLRRRQAGLAVLHRRLEIARVDLQQQLALLDDVALGDLEVDDLAHASRR